MQSPKCVLVEIMCDSIPGISYLAEIVGFPAPISLKVFSKKPRINRIEQRNTR